MHLHPCSINVEQPNLLNLTILVYLMAHVIYNAFHFTKTQKYESGGLVIKFIFLLIKDRK